MRAVIQRVSQAMVTVNGRVSGEIRHGLLIFLGVSRTDSEKDADYLLDKVTNLRIFPDDAGKMNRSVRDAGGELLIVSQFTLYGDCRRGRRPSFDLAAPPEKARDLYNYFVEGARRTSLKTATGVFQALMEVQLINDGPVTIIVDSIPS
jgi:D-tyrosyl-tRNA(Tyr) deacylase